MNEPAILVEGLTKRFGEVEALRGIDFEVPSGSIFGLLGPNGAGKTTVVRILSTIVKPSSGRAEVFGYDVVRSARRVRLLIGLAGQSAAVDPNLTGRENLRLIGKLAQLPGRAVNPRADELLERFSLVEAGDRPIRTYSGGMRRRLDVAAALVGKPPVIFLDEPTTGLDIQSRTALWSVIRELVSGGSTVLLTTQYLEEADQLADRIAVVDGGVVVANDTARRLKARLGSTVIELTMGSENEAVQAGSLLATLVDSRPEVEAERVRLTTADAPKVLNRVLRCLDSAGIPAAGVTVRDPSLDDVFLALTGHHAGDRPDPRPATHRRRRSGKRTPAPPIDQAARTLDSWIGDLEQGSFPEVPDLARFDTSWQEQDAGEWVPIAEPVAGAPDVGKRPEQVMRDLAFRAGTGSVEDNLADVVLAAMECFRPGSKAGPMDRKTLVGYLTLEQRFGRVNPSVSARDTAAVLLGTAATRVSGTHPASPALDGDDEEFSREVARILLGGLSGE